MGLIIYLLLNWKKVQNGGKYFVGWKWSFWGRRKWSFRGRVGIIGPIWGRGGDGEVLSQQFFLVKVKIKIKKINNLITYNIQHINK